VTESTDNNGVPAYGNIIAELVASLAIARFQP